MTTKMVFHGSDIEKICAYYHLNKEDIVKFGANVNPLGLSASVKKEIAENIDLFSSYPDRDYVSLRNTIAAYCQIPAEFILPGNGSSELISLLIQERAPKHTLILGPTPNIPENFPSPEAPRNIIICRKNEISLWTWMICVKYWKKAMIS